VCGNSFGHFLIAGFGGGNKQNGLSSHQKQGLSVPRLAAAGAPEN
jgi:hypothetical protein